jgi:hypothetical protein
MKIVKNENLVNGWEIIGNVKTKENAEELKKFLEERGFINYCKRSENGKNKINLFYANYEKKHFWILKDCAISVIDHLENEDMNTEIEKIREAKKPMTAAERQAKAKAKLIAEGGAILKTVNLSKRANTTLNALCSDWGMTKTEVINKLLEEQEQRQLL